MKQFYQHETHFTLLFLFSSPTTTLHYGVVDSSESIHEKLTTFGPSRGRKENRIFISVLKSVLSSMVASKILTCSFLNKALKNEILRTIYSSIDLNLTKHVIKMHVLILPNELLVTASSNSKAIGESQFNIR
jgi:hypothetical protein